MPGRRLFLVTAIALGLGGCIGLPLRAIRQAQATPVATAGDSLPPPAVSAAIEDIVRHHGAAGATAIVMKDGRLLYRVDAGKITPETRYEIASATKWLTAALVMTVIDEGRLSLDEPVSKRLPAFQGQAGAITLRQLLAQTAGTGSLSGRLDIRQDPRITLAQSAEEIARKPLEDPPGTVFRYGGPGFQVAGALAESATGKRWVDLFQEKLAVPLGMTHTSWQHLPDRGVAPDQTLDPLLQGGVVTTADDYMRFLTMLAAKGRYQGRQILSEASVEAMETAQTLGKPMAYVPPGVKGNWQYALGNWCESWEADGRCTLVSSPGAFGTFPWIDRESGLYGIFFLHERMPRVVEDLMKARTAILAADDKRR